MPAPIIITRSHKSVGVAILLTFAFGPLGLLYASITGGLIMTLTPILLAILLIIGLAQDDVALAGLSFGLLVTFGLTFWLINIIWAIIFVNAYNRRIDEDSRHEFEIWNRVYSSNDPKVIVNISQKEPNSNVQVSAIDQPSLQDWLKSNPGKSINDYFSKFGK